MSIVGSRCTFEKSKMDVGLCLERDIRVVEAANVRRPMQGWESKPSHRSGVRTYGQERTFTDRCPVVSVSRTHRSLTEGLHEGRGRRQRARKKRDSLVHQPIVAFPLVVCCYEVLSEVTRHASMRSVMPGDCHPCLKFCSEHMVGLYQRRILYIRFDVERLLTAWSVRVWVNGFALRYLAPKYAENHSREMTLIGAPRRYTAVEKDNTRLRSAHHHRPYGLYFQYL